MSNKNIITGDISSITTYDSANGVITSVSTVGNVTGNFFIGNGSQLTGIASQYANANAAAYLASGNITSNITTTGNAVASTVIGNVVSSAGNVIAANVLGNTGSFVGNVTAANVVGTIVSASGNVVGNRFIGNGALLTNLPIANVISSGNSNVKFSAASGNITFTSNAVSVGTVSPRGVSFGNVTLSNTAVALNAGANAISATNAGLYANPVRNDTSNVASVVFYNTVTNELTYSALSTPTTVTTSYLKAYRNGSQSTGGVGDFPIGFDTVESQSGSDISFDSGSGQITLTPGKTYRLRGNPGYVTMASSVGASFQWYNVTTASYVGLSTQYDPGTANVNAAPPFATAEYVFTPSVTTIMTFNSQNATTSAVSAGQRAWVDVQVIAGYSPIIGTQVLSGANASPNVSATFGTTSTAPGTPLLTTTLPTAGTYSISVMVRALGTASTSWVAYAVYANGTLIPYTEITSFQDNSSVSSLQITGSSTFNYTCEATTQLTVQCWYNGVGSPAFPNDSNGRSSIVWNMISSNAIGNDLTLPGNLIANVSRANYYYGNGAGLSNIVYSNITDAYSNTNVAFYLPVYTGAIAGSSLSTTGNVRGGNIITLGVISAAGTVSGSYFIGNGSSLTGVYSNASVAAYLASGTVSTNILTTAQVSATGNITTSGYLAGNARNIYGYARPYTFNRTSIGGDINIVSWLSSAGIADSPGNMYTFFNDTGNNWDINLVNVINGSSYGQGLWNGNYPTVTVRPYQSITVETFAAAGGSYTVVSATQSSNWLCTMIVNTQGGMSSNTTYLMNFDETEDPNGMWDNTTHNGTISRAGYYRLSFSLGVTVNSGLDQFVPQIRVRKSGTESVLALAQSDISPTNTYQRTANVSAITWLNIGDTFWFSAYASWSWNVNTNGAMTFASCELIYN